MASPGTYNFSYYRGDTAEFVIRPKTSNGSAYDLTNYSATFTIANRRGSTGTQYVGTATVNATTDIITCTITPAVGRTLAAVTSKLWVHYGNILIAYSNTECKPRNYQNVLACHHYKLHIHR